VPGSTVDGLGCDLSRMRSVRALAATVTDTHGRLDVLVNNAGTVMFERLITEDGLETTFAVNHLAPFLLTTSLLPVLGASGAGRVTVASDNHEAIKKVPWDDLQGEREYAPLQAYNRTKLMNVWFTGGLARRTVGQGVSAYCVSPGFVRTRLARGARGPFALFIRLAGPFQAGPDKGAATTVHVATAADPGPSGGYCASRPPPGARLPVGTPAARVRSTGVHPGTPVRVATSGP